MSNKAITVSQLNKYVKAIIENDVNLNDIYVKGEISNFTNHYKSGHFYLSLKDENAVISAVMFKWSAQKVKFKPENGMKVIVHGKVSVFERDGKYQMYIDEMTEDGVGDLHVAYEQLKIKLSALGLFDEGHKKPIPKIPSAIGVVTSSTGAAVRDIMNILKRRFPPAKVILYPVLVQGETAPPQIIKAIEYFNAAKNVDVIIAGRGGGSIEDLWAFNDEKVAYSIYKSEIPVISAVGHEIDFTIADFAADLRAPTPSAAAELAVPDVSELCVKFENVKKHMHINLKAKLDFYSNKLTALKNSKVLQNPMETIDIKKMQFDFSLNRLISSMKNINSSAVNRFVNVSSKLEALNPMATILRGYGVVKKDNQIIKSVSQIKKGDALTVDISDGSAECIVEKTVKNKKARRG